ncbi:MAG: type II toxin-antitoxin system Phd/YefM family antitoxin [bacterium]|nr:type II toxin-antitoxin system Phd/YefM family antitoxin [bacterium]MCY3952848.1 type II toxin-antitoxin system Phd/YefM family antitoxin [bacterium]MCY4104767.1 type II toxin-antitoxin system Phd/YefM family antitoxin [bacterium]
MKIVNIHEAKTHLSRLVREAADGAPFVIARSGAPLVKVMPLNEPVTPPTPSRTGFYPGIRSVSPAEHTELDDEIAGLLLAEPISPDADPD